MTGYKAEPPPGKKITSNQPLLDASDLDQPEANEQTQIPIWSHPVAKTVTVAGLTAIAFGSIGLFVASLNGNWNKHANDPKPMAEEQPQNPTNPDQAEIARLKTLTALGNQAQIIKQQPKSFGGAISPKKPATTANRISRQPLTVAQTPRYLPPSTPPLQSFTPYTPPLRSMGSNLVQSITTRPVDPNQAWQKAVALGSFGSDGSSDSSNSIDNNASSQTASTHDSSETQLVSSQSRYEADESALLSGAPRRVVTLTPGAVATASLITPVIWAQDLKADQQPQKFSLQLGEPLYAADGSIALPAGSQMIAKVDAVSNNGLMQLSVIALVSPSSTGNQITEVPDGAITVTAAEGKPLVAESQNPQRKGVFGKDLSVALMGALGQVGSLLNRPGNQTTMTSPYLSTTSISNGQTNILGGLLEGGFGKLADRVSELQQHEIDEILKRPNLWYVPAGKSLMVFTNSPVEIVL